ncbi:MAG: hypothetical protein RQ728_04415 [Brevefilum sp.]|nr:hypothetical protein [Brevefilum sp.]MDT8381480.1 hypothetical protein [Brevefilum sp.]MDW7755048.1 hypothetical protein [Brevefilum sp.]
MEKKALDKVCNNIYRRFPPLKDKRPRVSKQGENHYLLIFSGSGESPDGKTIQQTIRVVATEDGKIVKTSMSR